MAHGVTEKVVVLVELNCVFSWAEISKQGMPRRRRGFFHDQILHNLRGIVIDY